MKRNLSLSLEPSIYQEIKHAVPSGQISPLVNRLLKEYLMKNKKSKN